MLAVLAALKGSRELVESLEHSEVEVKILNSSYSTNDPYLFAQTHYDAIFLQKAWAITAGRQEVVVQVVDSGVDGDHPDLQVNRWVNEASDECADGVDNDGNGFVDDCFGYNHADGFGGTDLFGSGRSALLSTFTMLRAFSLFFSSRVQLYGCVARLRIPWARPILVHTLKSWHTLCWHDCR